MNIAQKAGLIAGPVTAVLLLAGCNPSSAASGASSQSSSSATAPASAAASSAASTPAATAPGASGATGSGTTGSASGSSGTSGNGGSGTGNDCTASELTLQEGAGGGAGAESNGDAVANWNIFSKTPCTMDGFPGVDLVGINEDTGQQTRISVPRSTSATPSKVTLSGSDDGQLSIEYLPGSNSSFEFKATEMIITPPNTYNQLTYKLSSPWLIEEDNNPVKLRADVLPIGTGGHN